MLRVARLIGILSLLVLHLACGDALAVPAALELETLITDRLERASRSERPVWAAIQVMYASREFAPIWHGDAERDERATTMLARFALASGDGLDPHDYEVAVENRSSVSTAAAFELDMTWHFIRFGQDIHSGRVDVELADVDVQSMHEHIRPTTLAFALAQSPDPAAIIDDLRPRHPAYARLRAALAGLRSIEKAGGWPMVPLRRKLERGMSDSAVATLRARLAVTDAPKARGAADPNALDSALEEAIMAFQARHGLDADGIVGAQTFSALNVPVQARIRQVEANLERLRWLPEELGERHILVNTANFSLELVDRHKTVFRTRVVVGATYHQTPMFSRPMTYIVLNPDWNVPHSIVTKELLSAIKSDPTYLAKHNYAVLDRTGKRLDPATIPWRSLSATAFPYLLRQLPGVDNALGLIKFMLPNRYNVYLHDTPAKSLFGRTVRAFSHGCVRVQNPLDLAVAVLAGQGWTRERLELAIREGGQQVVNLAKPIPVHLTYFTAWVDDSGRLQLRDDIYGRDIMLFEALSG